MTDDNKPPHGSRQRYEYHKCRCDDCRACNTAWKAHYAGKGPRPPHIVRSGHTVVADPAPSTDWFASANCIGVDPDLFFIERGGDPKPAKRICSRCVVRDECLQHALDTREQLGIWGGKTPEERRYIRLGPRKRRTA